MADKKISALPAASTPLSGTEVLPLVQGGITEQVSVANLTAGRAISATQLTLTTDNLVVGSAAKGVDFSANANAAGMTSELLDWYEEGGWTPAFTSTGATITQSFSGGVYTRVGRLITASLYVVVASVTGTTTNNLTIAGLPFASIAATEFGFSAAIGVHQFSGITPSMFMGKNTTAINVYVAGTLNPATAAALAPGYYLATLSYMTD